MIVLDCNNFWSPSGGGVRRYHLEKMEYYKDRTDIRTVFVMQDSRYYTEEIGPGLVIEHVPAFKIPGNWDYRFLWRPSVIRRMILKHQVDLIEVGSPYWLPVAVRMATWFLKKKPKLLGFWHADFPVTYVRRSFDHCCKPIAPLMESLAWLYAKWAYKNYVSIMASSCEIMFRMINRGIKNVHWIPLGVDVQLFHPSRRDPQLVAELKAGNANRLTIFFPHRLTEEKGAVTLLEAYPILCKRLGVEPAIVFAGRGNFQELVEEAAQKYTHIRYIGFIKTTEEVARWTASCDLGLAMSAWETFGLSILEAMASGQSLVGANEGAAKEHIETAGCGITLAPGNAERLADAIIQMVESGKMAEWGIKARQYAETMTWPACFQRQHQFYTTIHGE